LQRHPATRDVFRLNGLMAFDFGSRAAEIDLVSVPLKLAIEVDGYHHFTDVGAYRRDRRKDVLLQTEGFWVLRYLADDVLDDGDAIVAAIGEVLLRRRA
jgi:very-short-patch-repair endonuclease